MQLKDHNYSIGDYDIAVIGLSGRFPGAKNIEAFWENLTSGVESIAVFSDDQLLAEGISPDLLKNPSYVKSSAVIEDIDLFDANFFEINPREAEILDPQQRLFLECAWEALETTGYDPQNYPGLIGIYAGIGINSYLLNKLIYHRQQLESIGEYQVIIDSDKDFLPTRVAYKLNLRGPAINIQTACSTSLVAVHLATQSLLNGECDMALAGGVTLRVPQKSGYLYQEGMILSPDGHCRAFDAKAQGTVGGNGIGIVVLKRLDKAIADGDHIYAVIKGSAVNNDGSVKVGYTAPSVKGQATVIAEALAVAEVDAETITYIEAHGTGTELGDPIEIAALNQVFRQRTQKQHFCAIGSVKSNVGHLDTAAGVTGLIKTVLALKHGLIPPSLHYETPNPQIDFANSPFYVNQQLATWQSVDGVPRRAGVSSFGIGGTNVHVVMEEAPSFLPSPVSPRPWQILTISAKTSTALERATANLGEYLQNNVQNNVDLNLADVAYTLSCGRRNFHHRRILVCQATSDAAIALSNTESHQDTTSSIELKEQPVVFMFPGQGSQYVNMGLELYQTEPIFREQVDLCSEILKPELKLDLRNILYPQSSDTQPAQEQLQQTAIAQTALFTVEYALAQLWRSWGINPQGMIGHSIGEYVAACLAEVFSVEDALLLVAARGNMMQQLPSGAMLSVPLKSSEIQAFLGQDLAIAAINETSRCVVSGTAAAIDTLETKLTTQGLQCRRLHTSHAFHSPMMEPILIPFTQRVKQVSLNSPKIPYVSNLTGTWITAEQATSPNYWAQHLRQTVLFAEGIKNFCLDPEQILLEVGPGRTLSSLAKQNTNKVASQLVLNSIRHPQENQSDTAFLLNSLGRLWLAGAKIDWLNFYHRENRQRVPLPTYPFERQRYWLDTPQQPQFTSESELSLTQKSDITDWFYVPSWQRIPLSPHPSEKPSLMMLMFIDEYGLGEELAQSMTQQGHKIVRVRWGESFVKHNDGLYTLNPQQVSDYDNLLQEIQKLNFTPNKIIHLWSLTHNSFNANSPAELTIEQIDKAQDLGFYSLLFFVQAWGRGVLTEPSEIIVISNHIFNVTGQDSLYPEKACLLGPVQTIPQEYPYLTCRYIDIVVPTPEAKQERHRLLEQLVTELTTKSTDKGIAYRGQYRWLQTFAPFPLQENDASIEKRAKLLRPKGVYLVTGGLSYVGFLLAQHLAKTVKARLILTGRSAFPERQDWSNWLASHDEQDNTSSQIRQVQKLEELGAEVLIARADVSDLAQMTEVLKQAEAQFGQINGVIHAAGAGAIWGQSINVIENISKAECQAQFTAKVYGTVVLAKIFQDKNIDFCMLTSSLSSILGGLGFVAYSAVNNFMDIFVQQHMQKTQAYWISVDWDGWKDSQTIVLKDFTFGNEVAELEIAAEEGVKAFELILTVPEINQIVVSTVALQPRIEFWVKRQMIRDSKNYQSATPTSTNHLQASNYIAPRNETEATIANIFRELLGVKDVGINNSFLELGGDSLTGTQLLSKLKQAFAMNLPISTIFEFPTVAQLAEIIQEKQQPGLGDLEKTGKILQLMEELSEEEIMALLE